MKNHFPRAARCASVRSCGKIATDRASKPSVSAAHTAENKFSATGNLRRRQPAERIGDGKKKRAVNFRLPRPARNFGDGDAVEQRNPVVQRQPVERQTPPPPAATAKIAAQNFFAGQFGSSVAIGFVQLNSFRAAWQVLSRAQIRHALDVLRLRKHVQRLHARQFKDTVRAQNVQIPRHRRRMARDVNDLRGLCFAQ